MRQHREWKVASCTAHLTVEELRVFELRAKLQRRHAQVQRHLPRPDVLDQNDSSVPQRPDFGGESRRFELKLDEGVQPIEAKVERVRRQVHQSGFGGHCGGNAGGVEWEDRVGREVVEDDGEKEGMAVGFEDARARFRKVVVEERAREEVGRVELDLRAGEGELDAARDDLEDLARRRTWGTPGSR